MKYEIKRPGIKYWAEEERPREKLLLLGVQKLTDAELLAILLGSGTRTHSALDLARQLLENSNRNLNTLGERSPNDLMQIKGIGRAKAVTIVAALELGRRRQLQMPEQKAKIKESKDAYRLLAPLLYGLPQEAFYILALNRQNQVLAKIPLSSGGLNATVVDPRLLFRKALEQGASAVIMAHNHPSGACRPSETDVRLTRKLKEAGELLDITVLDHLIIAGDKFYSFADAGLL